MRIHDSVDVTNPVSLKAWIHLVKQILFIEDWHEVGSTGEPAFATNWGNSSSQETAAFRKIGNLLYIKGRVSKSASGVNSDTIFTLPEGYRPTNTVLKTVIANPWTQGSGLLLHITNAGLVQVYANGLTSGFEVGINTSFYLDN